LLGTFACPDAGVEDGGPGFQGALPWSLEVPELLEEDSFDPVVVGRCFADSEAPFFEAEELVDLPGGSTPLQ